MDCRAGAEPRAAAHLYGDGWLGFSLSGSDMQRARVFTAGATLLLASAVIVLGGAHRRVGTVVTSGCDHALIDLDAMDDATFDEDLEDELDDVYDRLAPGKPVDANTLVGTIMDALSDEGDTGDETAICLADLEAEMREYDPDSGVEAVVWATVNSASEETSSLDATIFIQAAMRNLRTVQGAGRYPSRAVPAVQGQLHSRSRGRSSQGDGPGSARM